MEGFLWPTRFHQILQEPHQWYLDGAHNDTSAGKASEWFIGAVPEDADTALRGGHKRVVIFSRFSNHKDAVSVLDGLAVCLEPTNFDKVIFTPCQSSYDRARLEMVRSQGMHVLHEAPISYNTHA